ncbi:aquaporin-like [Cloeon dipterum]|uniref:aquaporin-like n=1 Tax=Cloeon dipterum TaxID=197152 RepID=UPI00321FE289
MDRIKTIRIAAAEFIGTAFLVGFGCATCTQALSKESWTIFHAALGFGLIIACIVLVIGHISGAHINPAISVGVAVLQVISPKMLLVYIPAQICGGIAGYGMLKAMTPYAILEADGGSTGFCVSAPNPAMTLAHAFMAEFFATALLMLLVCAILDKNADHQTVPLQIGTAIAGLVIVIGHRSSASMNPARSLGPAFWNNYWDDHWLYWVAPTAGSAVAALFYRTVFGFRKEEEHRPEPLPLHDIEERK